MSWWDRLRRREPEPEAAVSDQDRAELENAQRTVAGQRSDLLAHAREAVGLGGYLRYQREQTNHLAERIRAALGE